MGLKHLPRNVFTASKKAAGTVVNAVGGGGGKTKAEYRWEELQRIEKRRRSILQRAEEPFWKCLLHWDGTVLRQISRDPLLYITVIIYALLRVQARLTAMPAYVASLGRGEVAVLGSFLTFFLVFWVNQNHSRYFGLYNESMKCKGRIFDIATLAVNVLPKHVAYRLVRYMNAAHAAGYVGLSKVYPSDSYFKNINEQCRLLTDKEMTRMNAIDLDKGGAANRELIAWCIRVVQQARRDVPELAVDNELINLIQTNILQLRAAIGQLYNAADLPVPFFYVHFISLLTALYLPLFAISSAYKAGTGSEVHWTADVIAGLVVVFQDIFVIGLRIIGQKMSDPYGDDLVDLSVMFYVNFTWQQSNRVLASQFPPTESNWEEEEQLIKERKDIGPAWTNVWPASAHGIADGYIDMSTGLSTKKMATTTGTVSSGDGNDITANSDGLSTSLSNAV